MADPSPRDLHRHAEAVRARDARESPDLRLGRWQDVLADVPDGSVRLLLTSPPYDNARTYEGTNEPVDFGELARFALRVLCPGGTLAMVLDGAVNDGVQSVTPYRVICEWAAMPGWRFRQFLVYGRQGVPGNSPGWFRRDHEPLLVFARDGDRQVCEKDRLVEESCAWTRGLPPRTSIKRGRDGQMRAQSNTKPGAMDKRHRGSVWGYGNIGADTRDNAAGHPAPFAEAFALDAVTVWSNPGDIVCDPYAGSATVGRACIDTGRRFVGAERVGPCPRCGGGFPMRCKCPPNGHLNYHAIGTERLRQTSIFDALGGSSAT